MSIYPYRCGPLLNQFQEANHELEKEIGNL